ncbi:MAG: RodZ domain-containing protein [Alphaproteobacteria bacterium]
MAKSRTKFARHEDEAPRVTRLHEIAGTGPLRIGAELRGARQRHGLSLDELAQGLRIGQPFLLAMEEGRFEDLPGRAYAIGFLRTYANHLGLDGDAYVSRYRDEGGGPSGPSELNFPEPLAPPSLPTGRIVLFALAIGAVVFGGWSVVQDRVAPYLERVAPVPAELSGAATTTAEAESDATATVPAETVADEPAPPIESPPSTLPVPQEPAATAPKPAVPTAGTDVTVTTEATPTEAVEVPVAEPAPAAPVAETGYVPNVYGRGNEGRIEIRATHESWVQINEADGGALFTRVLRPGDVYRVPNRAGLMMRTGNAGGLEVLVDGRPVPSLGALSQVKRSIALDPERLLGGTAAN